LKHSTDESTELWLLLGLKPIDWWQKGKNEMFWMWAM